MYPYARAFAKESGRRKGGPAVALQFGIAHNVRTCILEWHDIHNNATRHRKAFCVNLSKMLASENELTERSPNPCWPAWPSFCLRNDPQRRRKCLVYVAFQKNGRDAATGSCNKQGVCCEHRSACWLN
jgi:cysteine sulfinate desulfinase/cysteine desulfurase-like protein